MLGEFIDETQVRANLGSSADTERSHREDSLCRVRRLPWPRKSHDQRQRTQGLPTTGAAPMETLLWMRGRTRSRLTMLVTPATCGRVTMSNVDPVVRSTVEPTSIL